MRFLSVLLFVVSMSFSSQGLSEPQTISRDGFILTRDGVHLYYHIEGAGPETIVVSGGFLNEEALKPLAGSNRVIFYDARGRGRSDSVSGNQVSLEHQINDLEDLRQAIGLEKMTLMGWSGMGKEFAVYAVRYPNRVNKMIQVGAVPPRPADYMNRMMDARMKKIDEKALAELRKKREAGVWTNDPEGYCRAEGKLMQPITFFDPAKASNHPDVCKYPNEWPINLANYFDALVPTIEKVDLLPQLKTLKIPRLVIHGAEDAIPLEGAQEWVTGMPNSCLLVVPQAGHWPFAEQPKQFFQAVQSFMSGKWPNGATGEACS